MMDTERQAATGKVLWHCTMSLDGFVTGPKHAMDWMSGFSFSRPSLVTEYIETTGATAKPSQPRGPRVSDRFGSVRAGSDAGVRPRPRRVRKPIPFGTPADDAKVAPAAGPRACTASDPCADRLVGRMQELVL